LPPIQIRPIESTTVIPSKTEPDHTEAISTHRDVTDDIDVVHIRPLNNLSAFNFDCQQMNADRLNEYEPSPASIARRTIFSSGTSPIDQRRPPLATPIVIGSDRTAHLPTHIHAHSSSSSTSSRSSLSLVPVQQSFTSDTSVIDSHWLQQQQQQRGPRDTGTFSVPPVETHVDRAVARQVRICSCLLRDRHVQSLNSRQLVEVHTWPFSIDIYQIHFFLIVKWKHRLNKSYKLSIILHR
jgi:hypothetical protein